MAPARGPAVADACPGVLRLHEAADGRLARVRLPGGRLDARALGALAEAAALGSDIVELTSRASVQIRGLADEDAGPLARVLEHGGLLPSLAHDRVRNILAAPLAGRGPAALAEVDPIVAELDRALCADLALAELPGRFLFAVDDGTRALAALRADVELVAEAGPAGGEDGGAVGGRAPRSGEGAFRLYLYGRATSAIASAAAAPELAVDAARAFLALRDQDAAGDGAWRVRDLRDGAARLARGLGFDVLADVVGPRVPAGNARRLGAHIERDGLLALAVLPPLARLGREQLLRLAELVGPGGLVAAGGLEGPGEAGGPGEPGGVHDVAVRVSPWRTLTVVDVPASAVPALLDGLQRIGLVTSDASGWAGLSACAGLGACARALVDVRAEAAARAEGRDASSPTEHWSGCERRCGEPADVGVRFVARGPGVIVMAGDPA
jgi:sulfite reductase beta subunit-like hemoprotein